MNPAGVRIVISALDKTKGAFGSATRGISSVAGALTGLKAGLVAVAGAGGFAYMVKSSLDATDALSKTASKIGTTTEALSALRYAANLSGVETNTLDMAMQRFTRRLSEAVKGTGEAKGALQELQLNARDLAGLPLDQRMAVLADAFGNVSSETDKLRLAFKLFDSEGVALVNMLNNGSDGLQGMFDDAEALGLIMRSNAAKGVEQASDSLYRMGRVAIGVRDTFVAGIAPAIKLAADRLVELAVSASGGDLQQFGKNLAIGFLDAVQTIGVGFIQIRAELSSLMQQAREFKESFKFDGSFFKKDPLKRIPEDIDKAQTALNELDWLIQEAEAGGSTMYNGHIMSLEELRAEYDRLVNRVAVWQEELLGSTNTMDIVNGSVYDGKDAIAAFVAVMDELRASLNTTFTEAPDQVEQGLGKTLSVFERIKDSFKGTIEAVSNEIPTLEQSVESLTRGAMSTFTQSFTDAITGAKKFSDAMRSMAKSVVDSLIKMLVQYYITEPLFKAIKGFVGDGTTPSTGAGGGGKAIGGSVQAGTPYMVGERGQELFVPNQSGTIIPNNKLQSGGAVTVNQVINVTTGVQQTVRAEIANLMPQISNAAKSAVAEARMRGGSYSKALVGA
jgi:hypothetical protein